MDEIEDQTEPHRKSTVPSSSGQKYLRPRQTSKQFTNHEPVIASSNATQTTGNRPLEERRNRRINHSSSASHGTTPHSNRTAALKNIQRESNLSIPGNILIEKFVIRRTRLHFDVACCSEKVFTDTITYIFKI